MNFFLTGDGTFKSNIYPEFVTPAGSHGANFAADGQSLSQSLSIAREVFSRVERGKINFVLIGLAPDVLFRDGEKFSTDFVDKNLTALVEYLKLCIDCGAKPVCVIFPVAPNVRESYRKKFVEPLRSIIAELKKLHVFAFVDLFKVDFPKEKFADENRLTLDGARLISCILTFELYDQKIISQDDLYRFNYEFFFVLSNCLPAKLFHAFMNEFFKLTLAELKRKDKIKVAFVTDDAGTWCGDELYNFFARNPRFEPTVFISLPKSDDDNFDTVSKKFTEAVEKFKVRGLNVIGVIDENEDIPRQDIIIFLRPYDEFLPKKLRSTEQNLRTLLVFIFYGYGIIDSPYYRDCPMIRLAWKTFLDTELNRKFFDRICPIGVPRAYVSGLPKMDFFFDTHEKISFPWKMTRPDAKKIIWAPHWTIFEDEDPKVYGTFQYNFRFMYEFAKNHPETSWVVKPHLLLLYWSIRKGIFPSDAALEDYIRAWNDLPNAQFFTGGYYQEIFATSDGMIQDSLSFIAEYQFTHKPMIFLTRKGKYFNELATKILDASYCVDGQDLNGIAALMQKVFIDGDDPLKNARRKVFDELLNYRKLNGMSASEFIFHNIADEVTGG